MPEIFRNRKVTFDDWILVEFSDMFSGHELSIGLSSNAGGRPRRSSASEDETPSLSPKPALDDLTTRHNLFPTMIKQY